MLISFEALKEKCISIFSGSAFMGNISLYQAVDV